MKRVYTDDEQAAIDDGNAAPLTAESFTIAQACAAAMGATIAQQDGDTWISLDGNPRWSFALGEYPRRRESLLGALLDTGFFAWGLGKTSDEGHGNVEYYIDWGNGNDPADTATDLLSAFAQGAAAIYRERLYSQLATVYAKGENDENTF